MITGCTSVYRIEKLKNGQIQLYMMFLLHQKKLYAQKLNPSVKNRNILLKYWMEAEEWLSPLSLQT